MTDLDMWAISVAARECRYMNLTRKEQVIAVHLARRKGWEPAQISLAFRISAHVVHKMLVRDEPVIDIDELLEEQPEFIGAPLKPTPPPITRSEVRRLVGA